ncbi:MAG: menaquinone biosynthesis decarboxylase [Prolixibacteraceae bacterium]|nr:menaquinone biosynthesis decarboxylase [Prolixibacteraceae bacterium]
MEAAGLLSFVNELEKNKELIRVKDFVDPELMISEITDRFSKQPGGGKALFFENTGTGFPLLINAIGSEKRIALALGRKSVYEIENEIEDLFYNLLQPKENFMDKLRILPRLKEVSSWMPKKLKKRGKCQEFIMDSPDLGKLPVLKCWPADGGRYITLPCVHTIDPESKIPNMGMYRMQVIGPDKTGMHWHKHKTGAVHFEKYKNRREVMPVSVALGGDPVYTYAATAPMPENVDEYLLAGFLKKKPVRLVKCITNDLFVPDDADFIIEGYVDPSEEPLLEGPFGDHTGFYSLPGYYPCFHVTCISYRKNAVYPATIVGIPPMEDAYIGKATERIFLKPLTITVIPELQDMRLPFAGVVHNFAIVKIAKTYAGQAVKVMHALWGAGQMMFNKVLIVTDESVNIHDNEDLIDIFSSNFHPGYSLHYSKGPLDVLDHSSSKFAFGTKLCIDLTRPFVEETEHITEINTLLFGPEKDDFAIADAVCGYRNLLQEMKLPVLLLNVTKGTGFSLKDLQNKLSRIKQLETIKAVILFDEGVDLGDPNLLVWLIGGNIEPERDISVLRINRSHKLMLVDATVKTSEHDKFNRDWPNVVVMDDQTISSVDTIWNSLKIGKFIQSPSIRYRSLIKGKGAVRGS